MRKRNWKQLIAILMCAGLVFLTACANGPAGDAGGDDAGEAVETGEVAEVDEADDADEADADEADDTGQADDVAPPERTDVVMLQEGVPRHETLIVDILNARVANPDLWNPFVPGHVHMDAGFHQLLKSQLWEIDTMTGEQFPDIAATFPEEVAENTYQFRIRENLQWCDGHTLDANDVVFTFNMLMESDAIAFGAVVRGIVESVRLVDDLTVEIVTHNPEPKLSQRFGVTIWGNSFRVMPKHIWEGEDPSAFQYSNPLSSGPYRLKDRDQQGYWFLYEKRADWANTPVGQIVGEPGPQYILFRSFGTEERRIMAAASNEIDILQDITPEGWEILRDRNPYARAWYDGFPYANTNDPCQRGILFNSADEITGNPNVRWALALATDIVTTSFSTFNGMMRVSPIQLPPTDVLMANYHIPMMDWLAEFELEDGYRPFNPNIPFEIVDQLRAQGVEGLPTTDQEVIEVFGIGWWNHDPDQATLILEREGFTLEGGNWHTPDGDLWELTILAPADFEIQSMRLAFAVADAWNRFGVTTHVVQNDAATFWNNEATGNFEAGSYWPSCGMLPDSSANMQHWHARHIVPVGEQAPGNRARWGGPVNDAVSERLDLLATLHQEDPRVVEEITEIMKLFVEELPFIPMFGTSKFVPVMEYYWTGFQTIDNDFEGPWWWWSQFKFYTPHFRPTGR